MGDAPVVENEQARQQIFDMARRFLSRPRSGIHVSSLVTPLKHYYRTKYPEIALSDRQIGYFMTGRSIHSILQMLTVQPQFREVSVEWMGIHGTIDIWEDKIIEIKSTRLQSPLTPERVLSDHSEWLLQIDFYRAMTNCQAAQLWVFYIGAKKREGGTAPTLQVFDIRPTDLEKVRAEMLTRKQLLEEALANSDPSKLPPCSPWMCRECEYKNICVASKLKEAER